MRVFITGMGAISSLGFSVEEHLNSLKNSRHGISKVELVRELFGDFLGGEIKLTNTEIKIKLGLSENSNYSRTALLGIWAAKEAFNNSNIEQLKMGLFNGTSVGGMDLTENYYAEYQAGNNENKEAVLSHECGTSTVNIADYLGVNAYQSTISTACSSAANAIMLAARMMQVGELDIALAGGTDALCAFTMNGFKSLGIYDEELCRPFDTTRKGLNMGEGAGFLFLETEEAQKQTQHTILAELIGWGNANDAFHQTASSPEATGAKLAMATAMKVAKINPNEIDYINAHGTGTDNNDLTEVKAIDDLFSGKIPAFSSTKSYTGHTLAACGGLEAIFSVLSLQHNYIFPSLRWKYQMENTNLSPVSKLEQKEINCVLSNSFGFGGNNSTLIFKKIR